jgi:hypothetical protein
MVIGDPDIQTRSQYDANLIEGRPIHGPLGLKRAVFSDAGGVVVVLRVVGFERTPHKIECVSRSNDAGPPCCARAATANDQPSAAFVDICAVPVTGAAAEIAVEANRHSSFSAGLGPGSRQGAAGLVVNGIRIPLAWRVCTLRTVAWFSGTRTPSSHKVTAICVGRCKCSARLEQVRKSMGSSAASRYRHRHRLRH